MEVRDKDKDFQAAQGKSSRDHVEMSGKKSHERNVRARQGHPGRGEHSIARNSPRVTGGKDLLGRVL